MSRLSKICACWHLFSIGPKEGVSIKVPKNFSSLYGQGFPEATALNHFILLFLLFGFGLFASIMLAIEVGRQFGIRLRKRNPTAADGGMGVIDGAIFGLMGLLIAFTFSGAVSRFEARRDSIVQEANEIGTAYLRINLLPTEYQPGIQDKFRRYTEARIAAYEKLPDLKAATAELQRADALQLEIWAGAIAGCMETGDPAVKSLVLGSLNDMFDMAQTRTEQSRMHPPTVIPGMLVALVLTCALLAGNLMADNETRNWLHILLFSTILTVTVLVILDIEYPRIGAIRINDWDRVLIELRASMTQSGVRPAQMSQHSKEFEPAVLPFHHAYKDLPGSGSR